MSMDIEVQQTSPNTERTIKLDITNNWTGHNELPFEVVAERVLELEAEGQRGPLTITVGKPVDLGEKGWACAFRMNAMGRDHASPARGVDSVDALQAAFAMIHRHLSGMSRMHTITFQGGTELGFAPAGAEAEAPKGSGCPVMSGAMSL